MQSLLLSVFDDWAAELQVGVGLVLALVVIGVAILFAAIVFGILRLIIFWNYWIARKPVQGGATGEQAATEILKLMGIEGVKVEMEGFFRALFYNNHYNPKKKTVYLRRTTFYGRNVTSVALAAQKAALALQDEQDSTRFRMRWRLQQCAVFGPLFFIPLIIAGVIIDAVIGFTGIPTLIMTAVAFVFFFGALVLAGLTVSVERRATGEAVAWLEKSDLLSPEELPKAKNVLKTYILAYVTDFIIALLKMLQLIIKLAIQIIIAIADSKN